MTLLDLIPAPVPKKETRVQQTSSVWPAPDRPTVDSFNYKDGSDTGYIDVSWNSVPNAIGYKVAIFNGLNYQYFDAGNETQWTSKGKGLWMTQSEIEDGYYGFHDDGSGQELPLDPTPIYINAYNNFHFLGQPNYTYSYNYWVRVIAVFSDGESDASEAATPTIPDFHPDTGFTIADGKTLLDQYMVENNLNYIIGSAEYVSFLVDMLTSTQNDGEFSELEANPDYNFIRTYASTYLVELDNSGNTDGNFQLNQSITSKTINEIRNENEVMNYELETKQPASSLVDPMITYNRSAAISYADYWSNARNPSYKDFIGHDCTNFASQVVKAGGYTMKSRTYSGVDPSGDYWYYKDSQNYSNSWSTVVGFYNYWVGSQGHSTQKYSYASGVMGYAAAGDIVQLLDRKGDHGWYHTIVIAYNYNGTVTYDGHDTNRTRYSLFTISDQYNDYRVIKF